MLWVAAAGPAANFAMALFWMLIYRLSSPDGALASNGMLLMSRAGVLVNVVLMVLNLLPIPPLDGGRVAISLLPPSPLGEIAALLTSAFSLPPCARSRSFISAMARIVLSGSPRSTRTWSSGPASQGQSSGKGWREQEITRQPADEKRLTVAGRRSGSGSCAPHWGCASFASG